MKIKLAILLLVITAALPAWAQNLSFNEWSAKYKAANPPVGALSIESFGAIGDGVADDSKAFQAAFTYARNHDLTAIELTSGKKYRISKHIDIDYRGQNQLERKGLQLNGNGASVFLSVNKGEDQGYYGFNIITDPRPQQNTKFNINNIWFYTDNVGRPGGIKNTSACFLTVNNCVFYQLATAINFENAGMCRIQDCYFWGCMEGIMATHVRDTYIDGCHAFACDRAFTFLGNNNVSSDGNICVINSVANVSTQYNLRMKGLYTPMIANCVLEQSPINLSIASCQFGKISDIFSGPGNIEFVSNANEVTNDYWNIANLDVQGRVNINGLKFSNVTGFKVHGVSSANNAANTAVLLNNCSEVNFAGLTIRDSRDRLAWSMSILPNCSAITISNLIADRPVTLKGAVNQRQGLFIMSSSIINGGVIAEDNRYKPTEIFEYIDSNSSTFHSNKGGNR
jgi:hypothetical protein